MVKPKIAKKEWYPILAPKLFQNAVLGETPVYEPEHMIGKGITTNLTNLTRDMKRQNINVNFKVVNVQNGKAFTDVVGYYMAQSSIKRMIRRNIEKINMSFMCKTSDNKTIQIKPLLITRSATIGSVATRMRNTTKDFLVKYVGSVTYDNLVNDLVNHKLQNELRRGMNKIYPLRICEIRAMELIDLEKKKQARDEANVGKKEKLARKAEAVKGAEKRAEKAKESKKEEVKESKEEKKEEKPAEAKEEKKEEVKEAKPAEVKEAAKE
tara:strand:+ start:19550 stop:20350 length:801 start_codon:yes stop_codon:yes gene_type:complete